MILKDLLLNSIIFALKPFNSGVKNSVQLFQQKKSEIFDLFYLYAHNLAKQIILSP